MELEGRTCAVEPFSTARAAVKAKFDVGPIVEAFHEQLGNHLGQSGILLQETHPSMGQPEITIEGQFVLIDEGSRAMRYFMTGLAGSAVVEVEGCLFHGEIPVTDLHAQVKQTAGVFGGSAEKLLRHCVAGVAQQVYNQVVAALRDR